LIFCTFANKNIIMTANEKAKDEALNEDMISINNEIYDFNQYLENNNRCILSAKFGDGKTYFLEQIQKIYKDSYLFITIHPVNYQVAENQDIFDYIKRDILLNLLMTDGIEIDDTVINNYLLLWGYFTENSFKNCSDLISFIPDINVYGINVSVKSLFENIGKINSKLKQYKESLNNEEVITEFVNGIDTKGIYEFDPISQLICDLVDKYRNGNKDKKVVLIIEDLDRIDPAHIFRILNIFSAHLDRENIRPNEYFTTHGNNKFNLDKVITVCDFDNIQNIYHHLYGEKTDFNGYINKFSTDIAYRYSLKEKMSEYIFQNLLDPELRTYEKICNFLIGQIINKYTEKEQNIRSIKSYLRKTGTRINSALIQIQVPQPLPKSLYLSSINPLTKLLEIMKRFDILENDFFRNPAIFEEIKALIGTCFLAVLDVEYNIPNDYLSILYKLDGRIYQANCKFQLNKKNIIKIDNNNMKILTSNLPYRYINDSVIKFKEFIL